MNLAVKLHHIRPIKPLAPFPSFLALCPLCFTKSRKRSCPFSLPESALLKAMAVKHTFSNYIPALRFSSASLPNILKKGDILKQSRIFSSEDVLEYSKLSFDANLLHFDREYARNAGFEDRLVPGMLIASLFPRIIASHFPGAVYASQTLNFRLPVYVGDAIIGEVEATSIRELKKKYVVKFSTKCFKNDGVLVLDGETMAVLPTLSGKQA